MAGLPDAKRLEGRKERDGADPAPQSRDFFWDSITLYIVAVILALTAIDIVSEFIRGSDVRCYQPNETDSSVLSSVQEYVNEFCSGHIPTLQFLPSFIAIHAIAILAPHYVWLNAYGSDLDFFFRHVSNLDRNRQQDTGDYPPKNYTISREMEKAFSGYGRPNGMYWMYIGKIILQLSLCVLGILLVPFLLFKLDEQNVTFQCPARESDARGDSWPLPDRETVTCVFSPMNLLQRIWIVYLFLLGLAAFFIVVNVLQLMKWHTTKLGFKQYAQFSFETGMSYHYFRPCVLSKVIPRNLKAPFQRDRSSPVRRDSSSPVRRAVQFLLYPFSPFSIQSDYDFLMVKLFRTDGGLAYIMKEVHVLRLLQAMNAEDRAKLNLYQLALSGSEGEGGEFIRADTGWDLPSFTSYDHIPALNEKILVLTKTFRGLVMGFALRCEGGYMDESDPSLEDFASECLTLATAQQDLALKLAAGQPDTDKDVKKQEEDAKKYLAEADNCDKDARGLDDYSTSLRADQSHLVRLKKDLQKAVSTMDQVLKLEASEKQQHIKASTPQKAHGSLADVLPKVTAIASGLQLEVLELEEGIQTTTKAYDEHNKKVENLMQTLKSLRESQQSLTFDQQTLAKRQGKFDLLQTALKHSGPTLVSALVIGFDMESEGLPSALARIFRRVGFINFSSHYADYQHPLKVLSRSYYMFNATVPANILTCDAMADPDPSQDSSAGQAPGKPISQKVILDMYEVWYEDYQYNKQTGDRKNSNYVVVGPVSNQMQIATVNRMLAQCDIYLSPHALLLTLNPLKVGGEETGFETYIPPSRFKKISQDVTFGSGIQEWDGAFGGTNVNMISAIPYFIGVEDTTVELCVEVYRSPRSNIE